MNFIYFGNILDKVNNFYLILGSLNFNYLYFCVYLRIYEIRLVLWFGGMNRILYEYSWRIFFGIWYCIRNGFRS